MTRSSNLILIIILVLVFLGGLGLGLAWKAGKLKIGADIIPGRWDTTGIVKMPDGTPAQGARVDSSGIVEIIKDGKLVRVPKFIESTTTDASGKFLLTQGGSLDGYLTLNARIARARDCYGDEGTKRVRQGTKDVEIILQKGTSPLQGRGIIEAYVINTESQKPLSGVQISVRQKESSNWMNLGTTDSKGILTTLCDFETNKEYVVKASDFIFPEQEKTITVKEGKKTRVEFSLSMIQQTTTSTTTSPTAPLPSSSSTSSTTSSTTYPLPSSSSSQPTTTTTSPLERPW